MIFIKAITIKQPWATLIALGEKKFETRSWATKHRGPIAIHAGKSIDKEAFKERAIATILAKHGIHLIKDLPTGAVLAIVELSECHKVTFDNDFIDEAETDKGISIAGNEYRFGFYEEGRYAWELTNLQVLPELVPAKGQLSLWNWDEGSE